MKFAITKAAAASFKADIVAIGLYERTDEEGEGKHRPALIKHIDGGIALDRALKGELSRQLTVERFAGERATSRLLFTAGRIPARFVLLIGMGPRATCTLETLREAGAAISRAATDVGAVTAAFVLERGSVDDMPAPARARAIAEGVLLGAYRFDRYKTSREPKAPALATTHVLYQGDAGPVRAAIEEGRILATAQNAARDLVNTPGLDATPRHLAAIARQLS